MLLRSTLKTNFTPPCPASRHLRADGTNRPHVLLNHPNRREKSAALISSFPGAHTFPDGGRSSYPNESARIVAGVFVTSEADRVDCAREDHSLRYRFFTYMSITVVVESVAN